MYKYILPILIAILTMLSSCKKEELPLTTNVIDGTWSYEKVKFQNRWKLNAKNITNEYQDHIINISRSRDISFINNTNGEAYIGKWKFDIDPQYSVIYEDQLEFVQALKANVTNNVTGVQEERNWQNLTITRSTITFYEIKDGGTYYYKLVKN